MNELINRMNRRLLDKLMSGSSEITQGIKTNLKDFDRTISEVKGFSKN